MTERSKLGLILSWWISVVWALTWVGGPIYITIIEHNYFILLTELITIPIGSVFIILTIEDERP